MSMYPGNDRLDDGEDWPGGRRPRARIDAGRLWAGGLAAAAVTALTAVVGTLLVRGVFGIAFLAPTGAGTWGDVTTLWLVCAAAGGTLLATGVLHLLLLMAPAPFVFFRWLVGLAVVTTVVWPYATDAPTGAKLATSLVNLVIGVAIGTLVGGAGARSVRLSPGSGPRR